MVITVVGALISDAYGAILTVRKRGTSRFMLPGGKLEPGEDELSALARELGEELGITLRSASHFGRFSAPAANEPGATVRSSCYVVEVEGEIAIQSEIEEMAWIDPKAPSELPIAPLLLREILPALIAACLASP